MSISRFEIGESYEVLEKVKSNLNENAQFFDNKVKEFVSGEQFHGFVLGSYRVIGNFPCGNIEPVTLGIRPGATNYTMENIHTMLIGIYIKCAVREVEVEYLLKLTHIALEILLHPNYSCFKMNKGTVYNMNIFGDTRFGFMEGGLVRAAQIPVQAIEWRPGTI